MATSRMPALRVKPDSADDIVRSIDQMTASFLGTLNVGRQALGRSTAKSTSPACAPPTARSQAQFPSDYLL